MKQAELLSFESSLKWQQGFFFFFKFFGTLRKQTGTAPRSSDWSMSVDAGKGIEVWSWRAQEAQPRAGVKGGGGISAPTSPGLHCRPRTEIPGTMEGTELGLNIWKLKTGLSRVCAFPLSRPPLMPAEQTEAEIKQKPNLPHTLK